MTHSFTKSCHPIITIISKNHHCNHGPHLHPPCSQLQFLPFIAFFIQEPFLALISTPLFPLIFNNRVD